MSDIKTTFIDWEQGADFSLDGLGLTEDDGLETAVIISLFTDRRATADDSIPDGSSDRRGWWADEFAAVNNDLIGSRLWLLSREKQLPAVLVKAQAYAQEALQWLVDDGVAESVTVLASNPASGVLGLQVDISRPQQPVTRYLFTTFWSS